MEFILFFMLVLLLFAWFISDLEYQKEFKKLKKQCKRLRFEVKKLKDNEYYIFDYLTGMYEDLERGTYEKTEDL